MTTHITTARLADGTAVSFDRDAYGAGAIASALADASDDPGREVTLVAAEHPRHGGRVFATLRFLVAPESAGDIEGHVRRASSDFPGLGSDTLARTADDPAAGAAIAMRLLRDAGRVDACIFRPI